MPCILNIDTSGKNGIASLAIDGQCIKAIHNNNALEHASFLQPAILQLLHEVSITKSAIDAIAVSNGPGSYTGLRVGLASAKGLCYAWEKPLITLNSLKILALSVIQAVSESVTNDNLNIDEAVRLIIHDKNMPDIMFCSLLDARRMEVFFALYDRHLQPVLPASTAILDFNFLHTFLDKHPVVFTGNGVPKCKTVVQHPNAYFVTEPMQDKALCELSFKAFLKSDFVDIDYAEPYYTKDFYTTHPAHKNK